MRLEDFGWDAWFDEQYGKLNMNLKPGRVVLQSEPVMVLCEEGIIEAEISDRLNYSIVSDDDLPVIGDWVLLISGGEGVRAQIYDVLPRKSVFMSIDPEDEWSEILPGANIDYMCIVVSMSEMPDFSFIHKLARGIIENGAAPLLLFSKTDLTEDDKIITQIEEEFSSFKVFSLSSVSRDGLDDFKNYMEYGKTYSFTGFIGAGKSSIIAAIAGENCGEGMGLFRADNGAIIIDTDEISGVSVSSEDNYHQDDFDDFMDLAENCRYGDCRHDNEPGCAVLAAVENGDVDLIRYKSFKQMLKKEVFSVEKKRVRASDSQLKKNRKGTTKKARLPETGEWL